MPTTYNLQPITSPQTFIFIGRSGCGKGTQAELLKKYLEEKDFGHPSIYIETGERFRSFITGGSYASKLSKEIMDKGMLQPEFLAVLMWSEEMIGKINDNEHLFIDGTPRRLREAMVLDTALTFFKRGMSFIININVSSELSRKRLNERGRSDDVDLEDIERRLKWFETDVLPAIEWFRNNPKYRVLDINGEQTILEAHAEIIRKVFNSQFPV